MEGNRSSRVEPELRGVAEPERHQDRIDRCSVAQVVPTPQAFALEAEGLVQPDRRLVPGEDMELELLNRRAPSPRNALLEERPAHASPSVRRRDHQSEVTDVSARRMNVTRKRKTGNDLTLLLGDEHRCIGVAANRPQIAPLVGNASRIIGRQQPRSFLAADLARKIYERLRIARIGRPDRDHGTTTP